MRENGTSDSIIEDPDILLIGGGIMSATLGVMSRELAPERSIQIVEALPRVAQESSGAWNNAGTGHAALCELNYTPVGQDGEIDITKALAINERFETTKHFWSYLVRRGLIGDPASFVHPCPHMSFVCGAENQDFLRRRHAAMTHSHLFETMQFTTDHAEIAQWAPLLMQGRPADAVLAATRVEAGTDVDYGSLTTQLIDALVSQDGVALALDTRVTGLRRESNGRWRVSINGPHGGRRILRPRVIFIGAGGAALHLLQKSGIPEGKGYGGFPVSGQFLVCRDPAIIARHAVKAYGKAELGAPPMSVPHLDTRFTGGSRSLLFGPYAGFSPKFLKSGSNLDLLASIKADNLAPMLAVGRDNMDLTRYLIRECRKHHSARCDNLREFFPEARDDDWTLITAGQRVQIIKRHPRTTGTLQFGTEVVASADGSLATLLGASPGASSAVSIMLDVLQKCFPREMASHEWKTRLADMVPAYGVDLAHNESLCKELAAKTTAALKLAM
ncbi:MAG: malate dehydrogenase (quinone) [Lentisphaerae bacterium]|nr:malate dehydrogenase (quinone) [Lentisphaerota bacterium]